MRAEELNQDGCELLCAAIVKQAVADYRKILLKMAVGGEPQGTAKQKRTYRTRLYQSVMELREFFASTWFETLTNLDGLAIQKRVEESVKSELRSRASEVKRRKESAMQRIETGS